MSGVAEALLIVHLFSSASGVYPVDRAYEFSSMQDYTVFQINRQTIIIILMLMTNIRK